MKTTYKRETVLDKHNIKSCRAPAVKTDMKCCSFCVDSEKKDNTEILFETGYPWYRLSMAERWNAKEILRFTSAFAFDVSVSSKIFVPRS